MVQSSLYLHVKSKTGLKSCSFGLNFVTWPMWVKAKYVVSCNIFSTKQ